MKITPKITPFIAFRGCAQEAVSYYLTVFPHSEIESVKYYAEGQRGYKKETVLNITFTLAGTRFMAMDFNEPNGAEHSWAVSFYINCDSEEMFDNIFEKLSLDGNVLMGPEAVFNIRKAAWITDKYNITWQIIW